MKVFNGIALVQSFTKVVLQFKWY